MQTTQYIFASCRMGLDQHHYWNEHQNHYWKELLKLTVSVWKRKEILLELRRSLQVFWILLNLSTSIGKDINI